jgi:hypothetical protein
LHKRNNYAFAGRLSAFNADLLHHLGRKRKPKSFAIEHKRLFAAAHVSINLGKHSDLFVREIHL